MIPKFLIVLTAIILVFGLAAETTGHEISTSSYELFSYPSLSKEDRIPSDKNFLSVDGYSHTSTAQITFFKYLPKKPSQKNLQKINHAHKKHLLKPEFSGREISLFLLEKFSSGVYESSWNDFLP